jgi:predicted branched-subunit amino acid permease
MKSHLAEFFRGVRAELPILVGVIPFGMIFGVLALKSGLTGTQAQAMSAIVFGGSSQIVFSQLFHLAAPGWVIVLTVGVVNLRHALYSASLAPYLQRLRPAWKWLLSYLLTDEAYAVAVINYQNTPDPAVLAECEQRTQVGPDLRHWFFLGAGLALWSSWQLSTALGLALGAVVPVSWSLDFTLALTFIALVVPNLRDRAALVTGLSAGLVALLAFSIPYKLGLIVAALVGILFGLLVETKA